jgi:hypothetical protein
MEIQLYDKLQNPLDAVKVLGAVIAKSGFAGCEKSEQGEFLALACLAERKSPTELLRTYDIIGGKLRKKALAALAEFRSRGGKHKWLATGDDGKSAKCAFTFEGNTVEVSYTIDDARKAGLIRGGSGWEKNPGNMLRARVISNGLGMICPEIFAGSDDGDEPATPAPAIQLATAEVIDVPISRTMPKEDAKELADAGLAPKISSVETGACRKESQSNSTPQAEESISTAAQTTAAAPSPQTGATAVEPILSDELVAQLESVIGDNGLDVMKFLKAEGELQDGQGLQHLPDAYAKRILRNKQSFMDAVARHAGKAGAK